MERVFRRKDVDGGQGCGHRGVEGLGHLDAPGPVTPAARPQQQAGRCRLDQFGGRGRGRRNRRIKRGRRVGNDIDHRFGLGRRKADPDRAGRMSRGDPAGRGDLSGQVVFGTDRHRGLDSQAVTIRRVSPAGGDHQQRDFRRRRFGKSSFGRREGFDRNQDRARISREPGGGHCHDNRRFWGRGDKQPFRGRGIRNRGDGKDDPDGKGFDNGVGGQPGVGGLHIRVKRGHEGINVRRRRKSAGYRSRSAFRIRRSGACR